MYLICVYVNNIYNQFKEWNAQEKKTEGNKKSNKKKNVTK